MQLDGDIDISEPTPEPTTTQDIQEMLAEKIKQFMEYRKWQMEQELKNRKKRQPIPLTDGKWFLNRPLNGSGSGAWTQMTDAVSKTTIDVTSLADQFRQMRPIETNYGASIQVAWEELIGPSSATILLKDSGS